MRNINISGGYFWPHSLPPLFFGPKNLTIFPLRIFRLKNMSCARCKWDQRPNEKWPYEGEAGRLGGAEGSPGKVFSVRIRILISGQGIGREILIF